MSIYEGLSCMVSQEAPHLGGNIAEGDPFTFAPKVWDYLIKRFAVRSVLDLGVASRVIIFPFVAGHSSWQES